MANTVDTTSLLPALKRYYTEGRIHSLIYKDSPLLALLKKNEGHTGELKAYPVRVHEAPLASASVTVAADNATNASVIPTIATFHVNVVEGHAWGTVSHKALMQSRNSKGAFFEAGKLAAEDAMVSLKKQISHSLYRSGWGRIGVIATNGISGAVITLSNPDDVVAFGKGLRVQFSASESSDTLRNSGAVGVVSGVDRDAGTITFSQNISSIGNAIADGDSIFVYGNREDSATPTRRLLTGLDAWLPSAAPASNDSFHNVNRSSDSLLSGVRVTGSLTSIEDSLVDGALAVARRGGKLDAYMVSFATYGAILKNMSGQIVRDDPAKVGTLSFPGVSLNTSKGAVKIVPDYSCPDGVAFGLQLDTWELTSMGPLVGKFDLDGNTATREATSNALQMRFYSFHNLVCTAPGFNVRVSLA